MDELSPEARQFLNLAKQQHEPDAELLDRVRGKVAAAVLLPDPGTAGALKLKLGGALGKGAVAKLGAGVLAVSVVSGGVMMLRGVPETAPAPAAPAPAPTVQDVPPASAPINDALRDELTLLERASDLLAAGDFEGCLQNLAQHRQRFPAAMLVQERDGLEVLARCMKSPRLARAGAQRFVAAHAGGLLNARIRTACKLEAP